MDWSDFKYDKDLAKLQQEAEASDNRSILELIEYIRMLHEENRQRWYRSIAEDDDPEEWNRWIYRSGMPGWMSPPQWFIDEHASWIEPFPPDWEDQYDE